MNLFISVLLILTLPYVALSQDGDWDTYLAQYEKGPGSTILNMDLVHTAPQKQLSFIVITGVKFQECKEDGLPSNEEFDKLYAVSDAVEQTITSTTRNIVAGTFTHQCERLDYIYVHDTTNLRNKLNELYTTSFKQYSSYINIKVDKNWETYLDFLYPNETILETMSNNKVINQLLLAGDKLEKPRVIEHWLYFPTKKDRELFSHYATGKNFKIISKDFLKDAKMQFQLHVSRNDPANPANINSVTLELKQKAKDFNGNYDGWESIVVKE